MNDWREIQKDCDVVRRFEAPDGEHMLAILRRRDGLFCFVELKWFHPWDEGDGPLDDGYWGVRRTSGIFESQELAEQEALSDGFFKLQPNE